MSIGGDSILSLLLLVLALLVAKPTASLGQQETKEYYQGVLLQRPHYDKNERYYTVKNRGELLWWALNSGSAAIVLENDITILPTVICAAGMLVALLVKCRKITKAQDCLPTLTARSEDMWRARSMPEVLWAGIAPSDVVAPLYGSFKQIAASDVASGNRMYVLGVFDDETANGGKCEKFVRVKNTYRLSPFRAYLMLPNTQMLSGLLLSIDGDGGTTGIGGVNGGTGIDGNGRMYDLSGRRIVKAEQGQVYIKNGKKIINLK